MVWALEERKDRVLKGICFAAAKEGRIDLLEEVWNNIDDGDNRSGIFGSVGAGGAARYGQLHILRWLKEEKGFKLTGRLYSCTGIGGHLHVLKWLREQACPWSKYTFKIAAILGKLEVLQWLHDEGCPWPEDYRVRERRLKPEVVEWLRVNGYSDRIVLND